jgi:small subunit ribosomal protein S4
MEQADANACKPWLSLDPASFSGTYISIPERNQLPEDIQEHLIVEYYSR